MTIPIQGRVTQLWNALWTQASGQLTADGLDWNNLVQPGATVSFGFCADHTVS